MTITATLQRYRRSSGEEVRIVAQKLSGLRAWEVTITIDGEQSGETILSRGTLTDAALVALSWADDDAKAEG